MKAPSFLYLPKKTSKGASLIFIIDKIEIIYSGGMSIILKGQKLQR